VIRSQATEFRYERSRQPLPRIDPWRDQLDGLLLENEAAIASADGTASYSTGKTGLGVYTLHSQGLRDKPGVWKGARVARALGSRLGHSQTHAGSEIGEA
jgi:hypothetical protein